MATRTVVECDICGKPVNGKHQVVGITDDGVFFSFSGNIDAELSLAEHKDKKDACGQSHAFTFYQRYLDHGSLDETVTEEPEKES